MRMLKFSLVLLAMYGGFVIYGLYQERQRQFLAKDTATKTDLMSIDYAVTLFRREQGRMPSSLQELELTSGPIDPWTLKPYHSRWSPDGVEVWSYGRDQRPGGSGFDADVYMSESGVFNVHPSPPWWEEEKAKRMEREKQ